MKIGFIGLGIMGKPMCRNLIKAGYDMVVMDKNDDAKKEFETQATVVQTSAKVASQSEVVITMLPNSPDVKDVVLGDNGILAGAVKGLTVI
ncbi:MAG: NAD(P)-binding domain-containing protein, partial [Tannerella sp.]|nr:NAD(P)-binding domain-containing protein [Tannerella sp.]